MPKACRRCARPEAPPRPHPRPGERGGGGCGRCGVRDCGADRNTDADRWRPGRPGGVAPRGGVSRGGGPPSLASPTSPTTKTSASESHLRTSHRHSTQYTTRHGRPSKTARTAFADRTRGGPRKLTVPPTVVGASRSRTSAHVLPPTPNLGSEPNLMGSEELYCGTRITTPGSGHWQRASGKGRPWAAAGGGTPASW